MEDTILRQAIQGVENSISAFCRFITANDTGTTGAHQSGFYIPKCASALLFDEPGVKGSNKDKMVKIKWQDAFETDSRFIYYGQGSRNEYRVTRFGRNFPFFQDENIGDLFVLTKMGEDEYSAYVLSSDDDIDGFFSYFNLSPNESNQLIRLDQSQDSAEKIVLLFNEVVKLYDSFPETRIMAQEVRRCYNEAYNISDQKLIADPDEILLQWFDAEYNLFNCFEKKIYASFTTVPFPTFESFVHAANEVLNRRKSRAGKSLEHHLANLFQKNDLIFETQVVTELNKKPDFIFPNGKCYHNFEFPIDSLTVLGVKTNCKERWRQVLSEADRADVKYLFTLQQGLSSNQLKEMHDSNLKLIVPEKYISSFPKQHQYEISSLKSFIALVKDRQEHMPKHFLV